jgi:hypothetical protein
MGNLKVSIDARAFKPVLQELRYLDKTVYKSTEQGLKKAADPLVKIVRSAFPTRVLRGLMVLSKTSKRSHGPYPVYQIGKVRQAVNSRIGGRKRAGFDSFPIMRISQKNGAAMIFDMAQKNQTAGNTLSTNIKKYGKASRVMWPTVRASIGIVEADLRAEIAKAEKYVASRMGGTSQFQAASARASSQSRSSNGRFGAP